MKKFCPAMRTLKQIMLIATTVSATGLLCACVEMPVEVHYTPDASTVSDMSVEEAVATLRNTRGTLCFSSVVCGGFNPSVSAIELTDNGQTFVLVEANGDRSHTVPVATTTIKTTVLQNYPGGWVYFKDDLYIAFDDAASAKVTANALATIQGGPTRQRAEADFATIAKSYRDAAVKPVIGEDVRRYQVQAQAAIRDSKLADAEIAYGRALKIAPWWPAGHYNRALVQAELGRYSLACAEMKKYLALVPNAPDARVAQDKIYEWEVKAPAVAPVSNNPQQRY